MSKPSECTNAILDILKTHKIENKQITPKQLQQQITKIAKNDNEKNKFTSDYVSKKYKELLSNDQIQEYVEIDQNEFDRIHPIAKMNSALLFVTFRPHKEDIPDNKEDVEFHKDAANRLIKLPEKYNEYKNTIFIYDANIVLGTEHDMFFKVKYSTNELLGEFLLKAMRPLSFVSNTTTRIILPVKND